MATLTRAGIRVAAIRAEVTHMTAPLDTDDVDRTPPQTEDSEERGFVDEMDDETLGEGVSDDDGDIADEGPGHRG